MTNFGKLIVGFFIAGLLIISVWSLFTLNHSSEELLESGDFSDGIVYETEVDGPSDCSSYEKYDAEENMCIFECANEDECSVIQKQIDEELATWTDELEQDKDPVAEKKFAKGTDSEASYLVSSDERISLVSGTDTGESRKIWEDISALSPDTLSDKYIETYEVFNSPTDDTLAFVDDEDGNGKWRVAVNLAGHKSSNEKEQKATLIHELGHIITLNSSQVNSNQSKEDCQNFYIDEGCSNPDSYVNNFKKIFWKAVDKQDFMDNKFVTEYASANEVEDMAESFAFFVLANKASGANEKEQKINSFYSYPELVSIRNSMRNALSQDIVRARKK